MEVSSLIKKISLAISLTLATYSAKAQWQNCSPYHTIPKYELSESKLISVGYVSCFHEQGILIEVGHEPISIGTLLMGKHHDNSAYTYLQYEHQINKAILFIGPAYRINNEPTLLIGRIGFDYIIITHLSITLSILQINPQLNYTFFGAKISL